MAPRYRIPNIMLSMGVKYNGRENLRYLTDIAAELVNDTTSEYATRRFKN